MFVVNKDELLENTKKRRFSESYDRYLSGYDAGINDVIQDILEMDCTSYDTLIHKNAVLNETYNHALEDIKNIKSEKTKVIAGYNDLWNAHREILGENKKLKSDISALRSKLEKLSEIEIGDKVEVIDCGEALPGYDIWLKNNAPTLLPLFVVNERPDNGESGVVLAIGNETLNGGRTEETIYAILNEKRKIRLITKKGVRLVQKHKA